MPRQLALVEVEVFLSMQEEERWATLRYMDEYFKVGQGQESGGTPNEKSTPSTLLLNQDEKIPDVLADHEKKED